MLINVIGLGYIGLPTALIMAANGLNVIGTDINKNLLKELNNGQLPFKEDKLEEIYASARKNNIVFSEEYAEADIYIVAVSSPYIKENKKVDTRFIVEAVKRVLLKCKKGSIIVIESTIPPNTINTCIKPLIQASSFKLGIDIHLAHAPERVIPGNMIYELTHNSRTIGADSIEIAEKIREVYSKFCKGEIVLTDICTAEMTKVVENTYRDINIAYANELAKICHASGLDVYEIIRIANKHPRVNILQPGPGVGGHCIAVDPWFLVGDYPGLANIILAARKINDSMPEFVLERISDIMEENHVNDISRVGLYGLTYKENVDDIRESPTLQLLECMKKHLAKGIKVYDPYVKNQIVDNQFFDFNKFIQDIDIIVIMVAHNEIKNNFDKLENKIVFDTRNIYKKARYKL